MTPKQTELVRLLSQGMSLKEISKRQGKKYSAVKCLAWFLKRRVGQPLAVIIYRYEEGLRHAP